MMDIHEARFWSGIDVIAARRQARQFDCADGMCGADDCTRCRPGAARAEVRSGKCPECRGTGEIKDGTCEVCGGSGSDDPEDAITQVESPLPARSLTG